MLSALLFAPAAPFAQSGVERSDRLGIAHISYSSGSRSSTRYVNALEGGARWNRWVMYWSDIERSRGAYDWSGPDATIAADREFGFETNAVLLGTPGFHNSALSAQGETRLDVGDKSAAFAVMRGLPIRRAAGAAIAPPHGLYAPVWSSENVWARFVEAAATRYRGQVRAWEIWNEPDFSQFWSGSVADYVQMLRVAHQVIKTVDPSAQVLVGGMMYWEWTNRAGVEHAWLRAFLDELGRDASASANSHYFDAIPFHWYSRPSDVYDRTLSARALLEARGIRGKSVWVNEANAPACGEPPLNVSCSDPNYRGSATTQEQAAFMIQFVAYALAANVERAFAFQLYDDGQGESFGLFRNDGTARPAYTAYQVAARELGQARSATRQTAGNIERIVVATPGGRTTVLWARGPRDELAEVPAASPRARLVEVDGSTSQIEPVGGVYRFPLGRATNNRTFANNPNDYIIGGPPRILVEAPPVYTVPTMVPGGERRWLPAGPQREALP